ncbi:MAG: glycosyltransferase family 4 protein [Candidatus Kariarchaeaceae archaeon]|jgi:glycosyltransferase involved in cell wall biosynthesis
MHILYLHQHFAVPQGSTGTRSYEFARRWIDSGHKVTIITGHYDLGGLEKESGLLSRKIVNGINVHIVGIRYSNKQSFLHRIMSFIMFMFCSIFAGLATKKVDVIYATSTPLTVGIPAMILKCLKRIPFVFEVRDQWPEIPIEMNIIRNPLLKKILLWLEKRIYKSSSGIVALSPGMAEGIKKVITDIKPIEIVPNSCDKDVFRPDINGSKLRKEYSWSDKIVFLHFGAMGKANGLNFIIDAAEKLKDNRNILFVLLGEGSEKRHLKQSVTQKKINNIEIHDSVPKSKLPELIAACDVSMVIFAHFPILQHNSANKFFDSLSAGKPLLLNYSGWQRDILENNNAGLGCDLCDLKEFVEKILYLESHKDKLAVMGKNSRRVALDKFDRDKLARQVLAFMETVLK